MIIYDIFQSLNIDIQQIEIIPYKRTARCAKKFCCGDGNSKYLLVIAESKIQQFYLQRSIEKQVFFSNEWSSEFSFILPLGYGIKHGFFYAVYPFCEAGKVDKDRCVHALKMIYSKYGKMTQVTQDVINKIEEDFLSAFPERFHKSIRKLKIYNMYFESLRNEKELFICRAHEDYAINNILQKGQELFLLDFEFSTDYQVAEYDIYYFYHTQGRKANRLMLNEIHDIKYQLQDAINLMIDSSQKPEIRYTGKEELDKKYIQMMCNYWKDYNSHEYKILMITEDGNEFLVPFLIKKNKIIMGVYLIAISQWAFCELVEFVFEHEKSINSILVEASLNYYDGLDIAQNSDDCRYLLEFDKENKTYKREYVDYELLLYSGQIEKSEVWG